MLNITTILNITSRWKIHKSYSVGIDPVSEAGDLGVDPGRVGAAADAPGDEPHHGPAAGLRLAHQRRAPVPGAGVLAHLAPRTHLATVQLEPVTGPAPLLVQRRLE